MSLWQPELLKTQIRAILRVKPYGQCKILLPMIATLTDLRQVRKVIDEEMVALGRTAPIEVGIMVEVPSAALISSTAVYLGSLAATWSKKSALPASSVGR